LNNGSSMFALSPWWSSTLSALLGHVFLGDFGDGGLAGDAGAWRTFLMDPSRAFLNSALVNISELNDRLLFRAGDDVRDRFGLGVLGFLGEGDRDRLVLRCPSSGLFRSLFGAPPEFAGFALVLAVSFRHLFIVNWLGRPMDWRSVTKPFDAAVTGSVRTNSSCLHSSAL